MIMEITGSGNDDLKQLELPPGFRFYPSDEELISHYLAMKVLDPSFGCLAIGEADLNKCEPWDLPWRAKMGEKEWYFFSLKDRKYPTGMRTNRATESGYWKATGKDKEIYKMKTLVGMKKTLVFYRGRAPKGEKTNWVMHEFRLEGKYSLQNLPKSAKNEWVISRVFEKCSGGKKTHMANLSANGQLLGPETLPPLMDSSPYMSKQSGTEGEGEGDGSHVTCYSNPSETQPQKAKDELVVDSYYNNHGINTSIPSSSRTFPENTITNYNFGTQYVPSYTPQPQQGAQVMQDQTSILKTMLESRRWNNNNNNWNMKIEAQQPTGLVVPSNVNNSHNLNAAPIQPGSGTFHQMPVDDLDSIWNYFMQ